MTLDEFLAHLAQTPRTWSVDWEGTREVDAGALRSGPDGCDCPIVAVHNMLHPDAPITDSNMYSEAAAALGLNSVDRNAIVDAADGRWWCGAESANVALVEVVRDKLLSACGL